MINKTDEVKFENIIDTEFVPKGCVWKSPLFRIELDIRLIESY